MNITKKVRMIRKLAKEVEGEVEDNYFLIHSRKYYLKKGKIYTSNHYTKPVGSITNQGEIEMHKKHKKSKSRKVILANRPSNNSSNNSSTRSSNNSSTRSNSGNKNMSRRININKNKNGEETPTVTNLNMKTVLHESNKEEPVMEESIPEEKPLEETAPAEEQITEEPVVEESTEEPVQEESSSVEEHESEESAPEEPESEKTQI